ncbi:uncharacterized protein LOC109607480 [Aethina tumida]|uniref:uncharacterized protein LOC109607480 n=1 Tax=Aethina tumida TaxID=116153 RepID=UPI002148F9FF|nr:uncharacterized protein LOC109607480 [Aethina tumida]
MNKILCLGVLAAVVLAVTGYNFDDSDFNQLLTRDLEYIYNTVDEPQSNVRNRRDEEAVMPEKCGRRKKKLCCAENVMDSQFEAEKELKRACFKEIVGKDHKDSKAEREERGEIDPFRCDRAEKHRKEMTCVSQCIGQKKNVLDEAGNPKDEEFRAIVKEKFAKESWFASLQDKIISTCLAEARNATANADKDKGTCNPAGIKLHHCMFREIQLSCPADQIKDEKSCSRLQERLRRNDLPPPPPSFQDE